MRPALTHLQVPFQISVEHFHCVCVSKKVLQVVFVALNTCAYKISGVGNLDTLSEASKALELLFVNFSANLV